LTGKIKTSIVGAGSEVVTYLMVDSQECWVLFVGVVFRDLVAGTGGGCGPDNGVGDV